MTHSQFKQAIEHFKSASQSAPSWARPILNLAKVYAYSKDSPESRACDQRDYSNSNDVLALLKRAYSISPSVLSEIRADPAFHFLHKKAAFIILLGADPHRNLDAQRILTSVGSWYSGEHLQHQDTLIFEPNNTARFTRWRCAAESVEAYDPSCTREELLGRFALSKGKIHMKFQNLEFSGVLTQEGQLTFGALPGVFFDSEEEDCNL